MSYAKECKQPCLLPLMVESLVALQAQSCEKGVDYPFPLFLSLSMCLFFDRDYGPNSRINVQEQEWFFFSTLGKKLIKHLLELHKRMHKQERSRFSKFCFQLFSMLCKSMCVQKSNQESVSCKKFRNGLEIFLLGIFYGFAILEA